MNSEMNSKRPADPPFSGLTWDHPRGRDALVEIARRAGADAPIAWSVQPLEGFESAPIADLAAAYDVLVMDHPHIGEAVAKRCLRPLEDVFGAQRIAAWERASVGPSMRSYRWEGWHWALPLDVACQVMARHPAALPEPPPDWGAVLREAERGGVAQSLAGPHAFLTLISMVGAQGGDVGGPDLVDEAMALKALDTMARLWALRPTGSEALNPIRLLEELASGVLRLVPLVFGYVTYSGHGVAFSDAIRAEGGLGGVLGGTGLALTMRSEPTPALLDHLALLLDERTQIDVLPAHGGQPSARAAWRDETVNRAAHGFYRDTLETAERALVRPRFDGFIAFQTHASARLREGLAEGEEPARILADMRALWTHARPDTLANTRSPVEA